MRLSKERKDLIGNYGQAVAFGRGIISLEELISFFNEQEDEPTTLEEMLHGLRRFLVTTPKSELIQGYVVYHDAFLVSDLYTAEQAEELIEAYENEDTCPCGCGGRGHDVEDEFEKLLTEKTTLLTAVTSLAMTESGSRAPLIGLVAEIAVGLYGILNFRELAEVLNHYHPTLNLSKNDILPGLTAHIETIGAEDVAYTVFEGFVVNPVILPDAMEVTGEDVELIDMIRAEQKNYERYLPDYEAFVQYGVPLYELTSQAICDFLDFLEENYDTIGQPEEEVVNTTIGFLHLLKAGIEPSQFMEFFQEEGFSFRAQKFTKVFMEHAIKIYNDTRMYDLNGHTPNELSTQESAVVKAPALRLVPKVGRNDLCPCGSGKKHKKCCLQ